MRIGKFAARCASEVDEILDCAEIADAYSFSRGSIRFAPGGSKLFSGQIYRATALGRALGEIQPDCIRIFALDRAPKTGIPHLLPERFQVPWPRLARFGFFGGISTEVTGVDTPLPSIVNDTASRNLVRRLVGFPLPAIVGVMAMKPWFASALRCLGGPVVIRDGDNEAIRETLGYLAIRGVSTISLKPANMFAPDWQPNASSNVPLVEQLLSGLVKDRLAELHQFTQPQVDALARLIVWHYRGGIELAAQRVSVLRKRFYETIREIDRPTVLVSSSAMGVEGAHMHSLCQESKIPLIEFEHGVTTGLSRTSEHKLGFSEVKNCDEMMVCSQASKDSFERSGATGTQITVIGLPEQVRRTYRRPLQRWLLRRALGIGLRRQVVIHVGTTSFQGNLRGGPYAHMEGEIPPLNRRLIQEVYGGLTGWQVLFKDYPTQRFPYEPDCAEYVGTPSSVRYLGEEDFRYFRAVADVIVTMVPSSTLGWCVGADVPLIWLDSPVSPLLNSVQTQAFREAFLFVDMRDNDWSVQLAGLLAIGLHRLRSLWLEKGPARKRCLEQYITGPVEPPGRIAATRILGHLSAQSQRNIKTLY